MDHEKLNHEHGRALYREFDRVIAESGLDREEPGQLDKRAPFSVATSRLLWWRRHREENWG